jgi:DNA-binding Lrp family transcriptional regulator
MGLAEHSLDLTDVKILSSLLQDSRTSYRSIGTSVHLTTNAVKSRIIKMISDGVILGFRMTVDVGVFGFPRTYYVAVKDSQSLEATVSRLGLFGQIITRIESMGGVTIFEIAVREEQGEEKLESLREALRPAVVQSITMGHTFPVRLKLGSADYMMMKHLLSDPKMRISELADKVHLSSKTAGERLRRMKEDHILRFTVDVDPTRMKGFIKFRVMIRWDGKEGAGAIKEIRDEMERNFVVSSPFFYEKSVIKCALLARNIFEIDPFLKRIEAREHVLGTEVFLPSRIEKTNQNWILREIEKRVGGLQVKPPQLLGVG